MPQITKVITFDSAHRLSGYEGKCSRLHGHTYKLEVTIGGPLDDDGVIMDFGELKTILKDEIKNRFDHKTLLFKNDSVNREIAHAVSKEWVVWLDYNPTAESMAMDIYKILHPKLGDLGVVLEKVKLWETPTSFAEIDNDGKQPS